MLSRVKYYELCLNNAISIDTDFDKKINYTIFTDENGMPVDKDSEYVENCWIADAVDDAMNDAYIGYTQIAK